MLGGGLKISSSPWPLTRLESQFTRRTVRVFPRGSGSGRRSPRLVVGVFLADSSDFRSGWASLIIIFIMSVYSDASSEELGDELQSLGWVTRYSPLPSCEEPFSSLEPSLLGFSEPLLVCENLLEAETIKRRAELFTDVDRSDETFSSHLVAQLLTQSSVTRLLSAGFWSTPPEQTARWNSVFYVRLPVFGSFSHLILGALWHLAAQILEPRP